MTKDFSTKEYNIKFQPHDTLQTLFFHSLILHKVLVDCSPNLSIFGVHSGGNSPFL